MSENFKIILASNSHYRAQQLRNIELQFTQISPDVDEDRFKTEIKNPVELALKLSEAKANSVVNIVKETLDFMQNLTYLIIGSDQVVNIEDKNLDKPKTVENAVHQLKMLSGKEHSLITALTIIKLMMNATQKKQGFVKQRMKMHLLSDEQIKNYVLLDNPVNCAGSYMIEGAGITLFEKISGEDFTSITGLPMLKLVQFMREFGFSFDYTINQF